MPSYLETNNPKWFRSAVDLRVPWKTSSTLLSRMTSPFDLPTRILCLPSSDLYMTTPIVDVVLDSISLMLTTAKKTYSSRSHVLHLYCKITLDPWVNLLLPFQKFLFRILANLLIQLSTQHLAHYNSYYPIHTFTRPEIPPYTNGTWTQLPG